jgi:Zn-dependent protease with chaperone function
MDISVKKRVFGSVTLAFLLLLAGTARAQDIGKAVERGIGEMVAEELEATYGVVKDPLLAGWVNRVGQRLAAVSGRTNLKYSFKVLDSDEINAVAAPGGFIYVNRGALAFVKSEDELAAVLGHEVGHVAGRHAMKQLNAQLLGALVLAGFQAARAETLREFGSIAGGLAMLKFSRDEENDADRRGLRNAVASGYDGKAMLAFFRRLQTTEKEKPSSLEIYFLNHPPTDERLRRISKEPGTADSAANAAALGDGYASRSLYRKAADAYTRSLQLDPGNADVRHRMAEALLHTPQKQKPSSIDSDARAARLQELAALDEELSAAQQAAEQDVRRLADSQKGMNGELETTARSLASAGGMIRWGDVVQTRQFVRMARSFDQAARAGANLRAARTAAEDTFKALARMRAAMQTAVEQGDGAAAIQAAGLRMVLPQILQDVAAGLQQARRCAGDARSGARTLRETADSLLDSYRLPFGYSSGHFDILDLQVSTAQDSLSNAAGASRRALSSVAHARVEMLVQRINFLTRSLAPDDPAVAGILAHYLGVEPSAVTAMRARLEFGDAALALAQEQVEKARGKKKSAEPLQWENAAVLFNLMANDIERETAPEENIAANERELTRMIDGSG